MQGSLNYLCCHGPSSRILTVSNTPCTLDCLSRQECRIKAAESATAATLYRRRYSIVSRAIVLWAAVQPALQHLLTQMCNYHTSKVALQNAYSILPVLQDHWHKGNGRNSCSTKLWRHWLVLDRQWLLQAIGVAEDAGKLAESEPDEAAMIDMPQPYAAVLSAWKQDSSTRLL